MANGNTSSLQRCAVDKFSALAEFDGSVIVERTVGEVSARCHDEKANFFPLSLMREIVIGNKTAEQARHYYAKEFTDAQRKRSTPYMEGLRFSPDEGIVADPDAQILSDDDLQEVVREGKGRHPQ
jgi:hypothetical protein